MNNEIIKADRIFTAFNHTDMFHALVFVEHRPHLTVVIHDYRHDRFNPTRLVIPVRL